MNQIGLFLKGKEPSIELEIWSDLNLPVSNNKNDFQFSIELCTNGWGISCVNLPKMNPLEISFLNNPIVKRLKQVSRSSDSLSKMLKKSMGSGVAIDGTAGLGKDSLHLLGIGYKVTSIEKNPILFRLLKIAHNRALDSKLNHIFERLQIIEGVSQNFFLKHDTQLTVPDLIFLDPMFSSEDKGTALSGKEMQILHQLLTGDINDDFNLAKSALDYTKNRLIIKRPHNAEPILPNPRHQLDGKSIRYDVYYKI